MKLSGKLCANCFKIVTSVSTTAERHEGSFKVLAKRPGNVQISLQCAQGHSWTIGMQSRKAKNWCRQCKDELRVEHDRLQQEELTRLHQEQQQAQAELFEEALVADVQVENPESETEQRLREVLFEQLLVQQMNPLNPDLQTEVVELVLSVD